MKQEQAEAIANVICRAIDYFHVSRRSLDTKLGDGTTGQQYQEAQALMECGRLDLVDALVELDESDDKPQAAKPAA